MEGAVQNTSSIKKTLSLAWKSIPEAKIPNYDSIQIEVSFASLGKMKKLNREFRDRDKPTDVLSFPYHFSQPTGEYLLGELILCLPHIKKQASQNNVTLKEELQRMAVHGLLHLLGYDHELGKKEKAKMFRLQAKILASMGIEPTLEWQLLGRSKPLSSLEKSSPKKSLKRKRRKSR